MDYPRDNVFTFLFSTYKRTSGIVFTAIVILAVPITILLLGNQQDVRQRASGPTSNEEKVVCDSLLQQITGLEQAGQCVAPVDKTCNDLKARFLLLNCDGSQTACVPKPPECNSIISKITNVFTGKCNEPINGWCPVPTPTPTPPGTSSTQNTIVGASSAQGGCNTHQADANCDGKVNTDDFNIWRDAFVTMSPR